MTALDETADQSIDAAHGPTMTRAERSELGECHGDLLLEIANGGES